MNRNKEIIWTILLTFCIEYSYGAGRNIDDNFQIYEINSKHVQNLTLTCNTSLIGDHNESHYKIEWYRGSDLINPNYIREQRYTTISNNTNVIKLFNLKLFHQNRTYECRIYNRNNSVIYTNRFHISTYDIDLSTQLWNATSIERTIHTNSIELRFILNDSKNDEYKILLFRQNDSVAMLNGNISPKNNTKLRLNNLDPNTVYQLQILTVIASQRFQNSKKFHLILNQTLKTNTSTSIQQTITDHFANECTIEPNPNSVQIIEIINENIVKISKKPASNSTFNLLNSDLNQNQISLTNCQSTDGEPTRPALVTGVDFDDLTFKNVQIDECVRAENSIQLKVSHNLSDETVNAYLWYHVEYKTLGDNNTFQSVYTKKEANLQLIRLNDTNANQRYRNPSRSSFYTIGINVYGRNIKGNSNHTSPIRFSLVECKPSPLNSDNRRVKQNKFEQPLDADSNQSALLGVIITASILLMLVFILIAFILWFFVLRKNSFYSNNNTTTTTSLSNNNTKHYLFRNTTTTSTSSGMMNGSHNTNRRKRESSSFLRSFSFSLTNRGDGMMNGGSHKRKDDYKHQSKLLLESSNQYSTFNSNYDDSDSIGITRFEEYVQNLHQDGDLEFAQLYEEVSNATKSYNYSTEVALLDVNRERNRYSNILTYDHSRVKLIHDEKDEKLGYINANFIDGYQKPNSYIATQGPMPNTFSDYWRMIWEQNSSIVIMITNIREKGRIKCDQYWPTEGTEVYGNVQVTLVHTLTLAFYTKRIFAIKIKNSRKRSNAERLVYQYHFTDWPDHGVPYYILPVLTFIKKSSNANPDYSGPIVVHCSAGVGRTGCYIVIESMLRQIQIKQSINVHTFLKHIRHQRNYLVQTEEQFIFIYDVLLESLKSGETELTETNYKTYVNGLTSVDELGVKLIDQQFQLITEFKPKEYHYSFAQMPYNLAKNRNQSIIPLNMTRVILSKKPGVDGSEYINATYLHGSARNDEFIITQHPMTNIKSNFWQMIWDNNATHVVSLYGDDKLDNCDQYWLKQEQPLKCDSFTVLLKDEIFDMDFIYRDFLLQSIDEDYEFNCRIISASYWPDGCVTVKSSFDLINRVRQFRAHMSTNASVGPIIVHDLYGGYRAATFCCLYTFQDLMQQENCVNVYELAKMYHLKRPGIWINSSNILFLYQAAEYLFDEHVQKQVHTKTESSKLNTTSTITSSTSTCSSISLENYTNRATNADLAHEKFDNIHLVDETFDNVDEHGNGVMLKKAVSTYDNTNIGVDDDDDGDGIDAINESTANKRISALFRKKFNFVKNKSSNLRRSLLLSFKRQNKNADDLDGTPTNGHVICTAIEIHDESKDANTG